MSNYQHRIEWLQAVVAELDDLKSQKTNPRDELNRLIKLQAEELETAALLKQQKAETRKANSLGKKISRSVKAATEAFNRNEEVESAE